MIALVVVTGIILTLVPATPFVSKGTHEWNHQRRIAERHWRRRARGGRSHRWVSRLIWVGFAIVLFVEGVGAEESLGLFGNTAKSNVAREGTRVSGDPGE